MLFVAEHAVYALYISGDLLPFAGETVGRDNIAAALRRMPPDYEYLLYRPLDLVTNGDEVRYQVEFMYRHRASGEVLSGRFRMIMRVENGLLVRTDEYHDRAKVEAFMRLFGRLINANLSATACGQCLVRRARWARRRGAAAAGSAMATASMRDFGTMCTTL